MRAVIARAGYSADRPPVYVGPDRDHFGPGRADDLNAAVERGGQVVASVKEAQAIVWLGSDARELSRFLHPGVRWVQLPSAGVEGWTAPGLLNEERVHTSAAGAYAKTVAEHALALMLAGARRLPEHARASQWGTGFGRLFAGSTVVIVGSGGIGTSLIRLLEPFNCRVLAVTRSGRPVSGAAENYAAADLEEIWPEGDFFVLAAPGTPATRHMVGERQLAAMRQEAWLVNVARGPLIDTGALVEALSNGSIGGAALDVTDPEPLPAGHALWNEPRALITSHSANPPEALVRALAERVEDNVERFKTGRDLIGVIDLEASY